MGAHWPSGGYLSVHTEPIQVTDDDHDNDHYDDGIDNDHHHDY